MRHAPRYLFALLTTGLLALPVTAAPEGWHTSMQDGLAAAAKSNKPLLVVTAWKEKV